MHNKPFKSLNHLIGERMMYLLLTLFLLTSSCTSGNYLTVNNLALSLSDPSTVHFIFPPELKWAAIGFGFNLSSPPMENCTIFMIYNNQLHAYQGIGFQQPKRIHNVMFTEKRHFPTGFREITFQTSVQYEMKRLLFAWNSQMSPRSPDDFDKHTFATTRLFDKNEFFGMWHLASLGYPNPIPIGVQMGVWSVVVIVCLLFKRYPPLKSRGIVPIIMLLSMIGLLLISLLSSPRVIPLEIQQRYLCILYVIGHTWIRATIAFMLVLHSLRFLLMMKMNEMKSVMCNSLLRQYENAPKMIRYLKVATAPWVSLLLLVGFWFTLIVPSIIIAGVLRFKCNRIFVDVMEWVSIGIPTLGLLIVAVELLYDMIINYKRKCNPIKYVLSNEQYYFRVELYIAFMVSFIEIILRITVYNVVSEVVSVATIFSIASLTLFPLMLTFVFMLKKRITRNQKIPSSNVDFENLLSDGGDTRMIFIEKAKQDGMLEYLMIWVRNLWIN